MTEKMKKIITNKDVKLEIVDSQTLVHLNGKIHKLEDIPIDITSQLSNIPFCTFCGAPSGDKEPLFTIDKKHFLCKDCTLLAYNTFIKSGVPMPLNIKVESVISNDKTES